MNRNNLTGIKIQIKGDAGPIGPQGIQGIQGPKGSKGDSNNDLGSAGEIIGFGAAIFALVAGVGYAIGDQIGQMSALAAIQSQLSILSSRVGALEVKTLLLDIYNGVSRFTNGLIITNGVYNTIFLNNDGSALFTKNISTEKDIECQNITVEHEIFSDKLYSNNLYSNFLRPSLDNILTIQSPSLNINTITTQTPDNPLSFDVINFGNQFSYINFYGDIRFNDRNFTVTSDGTINQMG
jgi:hypothetical protein